MNADTREKHLLDLLKDHGGQSSEVAKALGLGREELLDLSNAVSPFPYPLGAVPAQIFTELPYEDSALTEAAANFYSLDSECLLAVAGTQEIIQCLPAMRPASTVLLPRLGYAEHARRWATEGHRCVFYDNAHRDGIAGEIKSRRPDVLVLIHPNNPSGECVERNDILLWRALLPDNGLIVIDEAFVDATPMESHSALVPMEGLIVLRSAGKFFGLPGLRLGFLLAQPHVVESVRAQLGPWAINAAAQWAGRIMLADIQWHEAARLRLLRQSQFQYKQLRSMKVFGGNVAQTPYFTSIILDHEQAHWLCRELLSRHIVVRYYDQHPDYACVRIGLCASAGERERLIAALRALADVQESLLNCVI